MKRKKNTQDFTILYLAILLKIWDSEPLFQVYATFSCNIKAFREYPGSGHNVEALTLHEFLRKYFLQFPASKVKSFNFTSLVIF